MNEHGTLSWPMQDATINNSIINFIIHVFYIHVTHDRIHVLTSTSYESITYYLHLFTSSKIKTYNKQMTKKNLENIYLKYNLYTYYTLNGTCMMIMMMIGSVLMALTPNPIKILLKMLKTYNKPIIFDQIMCGRNANPQLKYGPGPEN